MSFYFEFSRENSLKRVRLLLRDKLAVIVNFCYWSVLVRIVWVCLFLEKIMQNSLNGASLWLSWLFRASFDCRYRNTLLWWFLDWLCDTCICQWLRLSSYFLDWVSLWFWLLLHRVVLTLKLSSPFGGRFDLSSLEFPHNFFVLIYMEIR